MDAETVAAEFWAEQRAKRLRRKEIARMPRGVLRAEAVMKDAWNRPALEAALGSKVLFFENPANGLDPWLAEAGRVPQVYEALGLEQPWQEAKHWWSRFSVRRDRRQSFLTS